MPISASDIIKNFETIPELRKIIQKRYSFYAFLNHIHAEKKYVHLSKPFTKHNIVTIHEAKNYLNVLLEHVLGRKFNYITYDEEDVDIIVTKINPRDMCIIDDTTIAFFSNLNPGQLKRRFGITSVKVISQLHQINLVNTFFLILFLLFSFSYLIILLTMKFESTEKYFIITLGSFSAWTLTLPLART